MAAETSFLQPVAWLVLLFEDANATSVEYASWEY
jgi:hypothetical protein